MAEPLDPKEVITLQELGISNMYEIEAVIELLDQKGILTKKEILDMIQELRRKTPQAETTHRPQSTASTQESQAFPEPYLLTETENRVIEQIMELILKNGLSAHQAKALLTRTKRLIEWGEQAAPHTTH